MEKQRQAELIIDETDVDTRLYDGFFSDGDRLTERAVRAAKPDDLTAFIPKLKDDRLKALLPLYKARNFSKYLSAEERTNWENFRRHRLFEGKPESRLAKYFARLSELVAQRGITNEQRYLLEELQLYGQSIMPVSDDAN